MKMNADSGESRKKQCDSLRSKDKATLIEKRSVVCNEDDGKVKSESSKEVGWRLG